MTEPMDPVEQRRHRRLLAVILTAGILLPCSFFLGPRVVDHFLSTRYAFEISRGTYEPTEWPQSTRFGLLLPLALLQSLFGVNAATAAAIPMAASLIHILATYELARTLFNPKTALRAAAIVAVLPLETIHATTLYPDLLQTALGAAGFACFIRASRQDRPSIACLLAAGTLLGGSYLVKQTVVFLLLFIGGWIVAVRRGRLALVALPVLLCLVLESLLMMHLTGNPLHRHTGGVEFLAQMNRQEYFSSSSFPNLLTRFLSILVNPMDKGFPFLIGLAVASGAAAWRLREHAGARMLTALATCLLGLATIWPIRLHPFVPALIPDARHLLFLVMPMAILTAEALSRTSLRFRTSASLAFGLAALASTSLIHQYMSREDAGPRAAFSHLREHDARHIRAVDRYGHESLLFAFLAGYSSEIKISPYLQEDLPDLHNEWIVVDDRARIGSRGGLSASSGSSLAIPTGWESVWKGSFPNPWDPRSLLHAALPSSGHEVRVYRAPALSKP